MTQCHLLSLLICQWGQSNQALLLLLVLPNIFPSCIALEHWSTQTPYSNVKRVMLSFYRWITEIVKWLASLVCLQRESNDANIYISSYLYVYSISTGLAIHLVHTPFRWLCEVIKESSTNVFPRSN